MPLIGLGHPFSFVRQLSVCKDSSTREGDRLAKVCLAHRSPRWPSKSSHAEMIGFTAIYATKHDPLIVIFKVFLSLSGQILCGWFHMAGSHGHRVFEAPGHCTPSCQGIPADVEISSISSAFPSSEVLVTANVEAERMFLKNWNGPFPVPGASLVGIFVCSPMLPQTKMKQSPVGRTASLSLATCW